jgi:hypothetical protein
MIKRNTLVRGVETRQTVAQSFTRSGALDTDAFAFSVGCWSLTPPTASLLAVRSACSAR